MRFSESISSCFQSSLIHFKCIVTFPLTVTTENDSCVQTFKADKLLRRTCLRLLSCDKTFDFNSAHLINSTIFFCFFHYHHFKAKKEKKNRDRIIVILPLLIVRSLINQWINGTCASSIITFNRSIWIKILEQIRHINSFRLFILIGQRLSPVLWFGHKIQHSIRFSFLIPIHFMKITSAIENLMIEKIFSTEEKKQTNGLLFERER